MPLTYFDFGKNLQNIKKGRKVCSFLQYSHNVDHKNQTNKYI